MLEAVVCCIAAAAVDAPRFSVVASSLPLLSVASSLSFSSARLLSWLLLSTGKLVLTLRYQTFVIIITAGSDRVFLLSLTGLFQLASSPS